MKCKHHGLAPQGVWACPTCLVELREENERLRQDKTRLDWLQSAADARKVELARSILGTGYEIGEWPTLKVTVKSGSLRDAIDAAMDGEKPEK